MFEFNLNHLFSFFMSVPYSYNQDKDLDFHSSPRPFNNFVIMKEGFAEIESDGKTMQFGKGDILFIPKNATYNSTWHFDNGLSWHTIHFDFNEDCNIFKQKDMPVQLLDNSKYSELLELFNKTKNDETLDKEKTFSTVSAFFKICEILVPLIQTRLPKPTFKTLLPAINYLEKNFDKPLTVDYLASLCFLSPSRFYYLFKEHTGFSPIVYKNQLAISSASKDLLINQDESIERIANKNGFSSLIYFERLFKKITGKSPSEYRKQPFYL